MKKLIYILSVLLFSSSVFAIPPAQSVREKTTILKSLNEQAALPLLLDEVDKAIKVNSDVGLYNAVVDVSLYSNRTIKSAINHLVNLGYSARVKCYNGKWTYLCISWKN
jgi:hypothetical protein